MNIVKVSGTVRFYCDWMYNQFHCVPNEAGTEATYCESRWC